MSVEAGTLFSTQPFSESPREIVHPLPQIDRKPTKLEAIKRTTAGVLWTAVGAYFIYKGLKSDGFVESMIFVGAGLACMGHGWNLLRNKK